MSIDRPLGKKIFVITGFVALLLAAIGVWRFGDFRSSAQEASADDAKTYALRHVDAQEIAPRLRALLTESFGPTEVLYDRDSNRIQVEGPADVQQVAAQLLAGWIARRNRPSPNRPDRGRPK